jgi:hypothetical protein
MIALRVENIDSNKKLILIQKAEGYKQAILGVYNVFASSGVDA